MFSRSPVLPIDITEDASCQYEKLPEVTDGMCNSIIVMKFSECYYIRSDPHQHKEEN